MQLYAWTQSSQYQQAVDKLAERNEDLLKEVAAAADCVSTPVFGGTGTMSDDTALSALAKAPSSKKSKAFVVSSLGKNVSAKKASAFGPCVGK